MKYECHITIEPVSGDRLTVFDVLAKAYGFRVAKLLMVKPRVSTPERSNKDSFCTGHSDDYDDIHSKMFLLAEDLRNSGYKVWRTKIEEILYDCRTTA